MGKSRQTQAGRQYLPVPSPSRRENRQKRPARPVRILEEGGEDMRGTGGLWASVPDMASREKQEALRLLEESQGLLGAILMGVALQYRSLDMERAKLLAGGEEACGPGPEDVRMAASLITLCALFGFQRQAEGLAAREAQSGEAPDMMDVKLGAVSILISLLRLARLQEAFREAGPAGKQAQLEALDEMPDL